MIGKIVDEGRLRQTLQSVPVPQGESEWRCRHWIIDGVHTLARSGTIGTSVDLEDWRAIEAYVKSFGDALVAEGRVLNCEEPPKPVPTKDMVENVVVVR